MVIQNAIGIGVRTHLDNAIFRPSKIKVDETLKLGLWMAQTQEIIIIKQNGL